MAKADINAGVCGFITVVETKLDGGVCKILIQSDCAAIQHLAQELNQVDPYQEIYLATKKCH
jgi:hypothetical protein